jgi:hypothetical protein
MKLIRNVPREIAMELPGVLEVFPADQIPIQQARPRARPSLRIVVNNEFAGLCTP